MAWPDHLLTLVQRDQQKKGRGHLKIFLGMVAGVGKTYAMLQRAHQLKSQGVDVVIGWIDTHGRKDTEALVEGLEVLPRKTIRHRGIEVTELDLDAVLQRRPKVVIIDELAHTNAPGMRHEKRYLDVLDILNAGIDVFTAVNIQHLESRVDTVKDITGIVVSETIPDSILDEANEVSLIDLPAEDLLLRLKEGRIYSADRAEVASRNFFTRGNLTALRELALRAATDRVDRDLREFKTLNGIEAAWKSSSRLMVAVFGSPYSDSLIRWTRQLADTMKSTWIGVYVDTGKSLSEDEKLLLERNTQLVRQLGGEFLAIKDFDLVQGILRAGRQNNVTQIIVGKTQRAFWRNALSGGSVVHRLIKESGDMDVYAVTTRKGSKKEHRHVSHRGPLESYPWGEWGWVVAGIFLAWFLAGAIEPVIGYESVGILFLMAVTLSGLVLSRGSVFAMATCFSLIHNFFFIPPLFTLSISKPHDILMLIMYFFAATIVGHLTTRLKKQNRTIRNREDKVVRLFNLAHAIAEAKDTDEVVALGIETLGKTFQAEVALIFFPSRGKTFVHPFSTFIPDVKELAVAEWVKAHGVTAGRFTETLPSASAIYFPLQAKGLIVGAIGLALGRDARLDYDHRNFLHALVGQINAGIEREQLHEARKRLEILEQADKLYRSLFDSVSHELKTPLTAIRGAASALQQATGPAVRDLSSQVEVESERLLEVVDNMLDMTRIESGCLKPVIQTVDVADLLGPALKRAGPSAVRVTTQVAPSLPPIQCDPALTVQILVNLLRNALFHAGAEAEVQVLVQNSKRGKVDFIVRDNGPGLPQDDAEKVFGRFFRVHPGLSGGLGLGLPIAKGFAEVQGGTLNAENQKEGGALFILGLPSGERME